MIQGTHQTKDLVSRSIIKAKPHYGQSAVSVLQLSLGVIRKIHVAALAGFHAFVESAEKQRTPLNDYWWDSPETMKHLFKN